MEYGVVGDGIAQRDASDDLAQLRKVVVGIEGPHHHLEVDGKEKCMQRGVKYEKAAVAGADERFLDLFLGIVLKYELVVFEAQPDGLVKKYLEQGRDHGLLEVFIKAITIYVDAKDRYPGKFLQVDIGLQLVV